MPFEQPFESNRQYLEYIFLTTNWFQNLLGALFVMFHLVHNHGWVDLIQKEIAYCCEGSCCKAVAEPHHISADLKELWPQDWPPQAGFGPGSSQ